MLRRGIEQVWPDGESARLGDRVLLIFVEGHNPRCEREHLAQVAEPVRSETYPHRCTEDRHGDDKPSRGAGMCSVRR
jgi:hypothetical protein